MLAIVPAALLAGGCISLKPKPDPTRYYVIDGTAPPPEPADGCERVLLIGPVQVAGYADQSSIVERRGDHEIIPLVPHRWAEPLAQALPRTLVRRLATALPDACVLQVHRLTPNERTQQLEVEITRFELTEANEAVVALNWRLVGQDAEQFRAAGSTSSTRPFEAGTDRVAAGIRALSEAIDEAIGELAAGIRSP
jgi:uncharacterized lipoprotein YmbA